MQESQSDESKVVSIFDAKKKRNETEVETELKENSVESFFEDIMKKNKSNKDRLQSERNKSNKGVIRSHRLKR